MEVVKSKNDVPIRLTEERLVSYHRGAFRDGRLLF